MFKRIAQLSRRLHRAFRKAYLRSRLRWARQDANIIEAEMQTGPRRLKCVRAFILDLANQLDQLEGCHD